MNISQVRGKENVQANLNREIFKIKNVTKRGLILSAAIIFNDTEKTAPLTPVDLGNLRYSRFVVTADSIPRGKGTSQFKGPNAGKIMAEHSSTITEGQGMVKYNDRAKNQVSLMMGYSANYAFWVHENIGMHDPSNPYWIRKAKEGKMWRQNSGPKWFESSIKRNQDKVLKIIAVNAKII
jgi:hypothetical protein